MRRALQYNACNRIFHMDSGLIKLCDQSDNLLATVAAGSDAIVEFVHPCSVEWKGEGIPAMLKAIEGRGKTGLSWSEHCALADLKRYLDGFDARSKRWK
jgi:hypothetical protein